MSVDKLNEDKLDEMLRRTLRASSQPSPADFTERVLKQVRAAEERRILARVVWQERLALAGCIVLGIMAIVAAAVFPGITVSFKELVGTSVDKITQTIGAVRYEWQSYTVFAGVFGLAVCSLVDLLVSD